jgi:hypothetical protein
VWTCYCLSNSSGQTLGLRYLLVWLPLAEASPECRRAPLCCLCRGGQSVVESCWRTRLAARSRAVGLDKTVCNRSCKKSFISWELHGSARRRNLREPVAMKVPVSPLATGESLVKQKVKVCMTFLTNLYIKTSNMIPLTPCPGIHISTNLSHHHRVTNVKGLQIKKT